MELRRPRRKFGLAGCKGGQRRSKRAWEVGKPGKKTRIFEGLKRLGWDF